MNQTAAGKTPVHLWIVGVVSLLWNGVGAYDYLATKLGNRDYIASMTEPMGVDIDTAMTYFDGFPLWMNLFWAIGVWGCVLGSVLLLLRSRHAFRAFAVALVGILVAGYYQFGNPLPGMTDMTIPIAFSAAILLITVALTIYARKMAARGVLR